MAAICNAAIRLCRVRATRLDETGNPLGGPNNSYVSDKPMVINVRAVIEAGADRTLVGGCDCIIAQYRGTDKLKRFDLEFDMGLLEPGLLEMMTGGTPILDTNGDPIGLTWATQLSCSDVQQPNLAFEAWLDLWEEDHPNPTYPFIRFIWPSTKWQIGDHTLQNDFLQPRVNGYTRSNPQWGLGIYGDQPQAIAAPSFFYDDGLPTAQCGWSTVSVT